MSHLTKDLHFINKIESSTPENNHQHQRDLLNAAEYYYLIKQYEKALDICIRLSQDSKYTEIKETASRCCFKLGMIPEAINWISFSLERNEPGNHLYLGMLYRKNNQFDDSLHHLKKYCVLRPQDYLIWEELANLFKDLKTYEVQHFQNSEPVSNQELYVYVILKCLLHAHHLLTRNRTKSILSDYIQINRIEPLKIEIETIQSSISSSYSFHLSDHHAFKYFDTLEWILSITDKNKAEI